MIQVLRKAMKDLPEKYMAHEMLASHYLAAKANEKAVGVLDQFMEKVRTGP